MLSKTRNSSIAAIFREVYNGQTNLMTPTVVGYGQRGKFIYELSRGTGFSHEPIWGVTVLRWNGEKCPDLSKGGFPSEDEAQHYVDEVVGGAGE